MQRRGERDIRTCHKVVADGDAAVILDDEVIIGEEIRADFGMHSVVELHRPLKTHVFAVCAEHFMDDFRAARIVLCEHIVFHAQIVRFMLDGF